jgi:hypothetical protein
MVQINAEHNVTLFPDSIELPVRLVTTQFDLILWNTRRRRSICSKHGIAMLRFFIKMLLLSRNTVCSFPVPTEHNVFLRYISHAIQIAPVPVSLWPTAVWSSPVSSISLQRTLLHSCLLGTHCAYLLLPWNTLCFSPVSWNTLSSSHVNI